MANLIDFDQDYMRFAALRLKGRTDWKDDELTEELNRSMRDWLNRKNDLLGGKTPDGYFAALSPKELTALLADYARSPVNIPEPLYARIAATAQCEDDLKVMAADEEFCEKGRNTALRILCDRKPEGLIDLCVKLLGKGGDLEDIAVNYLKGAGYEAADALNRVYDDADESAQDVMLDVLCDYPGVDATVEKLTRRLFNDPEHYAQHAALAERLGDERMIEPLLRLTRLTDIGYFDYKEIVNAIESLGGDPGRERHFYGDADYEALRVADTMPDDLIN